MNDKPWIKASEIEDYVYCHRGWWLCFTGQMPEKTEEMIEGTAAHEHLATSLETNEQGIKVARLIIIASIVLLFVLIAAFLLNLLT